MSNMTWLDLYNFLYEKANGNKHFGKMNWQEPVMVHDASTGDELNCDTWVVSKKDGKEKLVIAINIETIFNERT